MLRILSLTTILLTAADHWTTYLCLRSPIEGWVATEANPFADWLFQSAGLGTGLAIDSAVTLFAVCFLATTRVFNRNTKMALMAIVSCSTGYAVVNNLDAISQMGLSLWSGLA
jgi:hypothetical protein